MTAREIPGSVVKSHNFGLFHAERAKGTPAGAGSRTASTPMTTSLLHLILETAQSFI